LTKSGYDKNKHNGCPSACDDSKYSITNKLYTDPSTLSKYFFDVADFQNQIYNDGPFTLAFDVYNSFFSYKSGIYEEKNKCQKKDETRTAKSKCDEDDQDCCVGSVGGHAVEIVGYGKNKGQGYWILKNSWDCNWGELGFANISWNMQEDFWGYGAGPKDSKTYKDVLPADWVGSCSGSDNDISAKSKGNCAKLNEFDVCLKCKNGFVINDDGKDCHKESKEEANEEKKKEEQKKEQKKEKEKTEEKKDENKKGQEEFVPCNTDGWQCGNTCFGWPNSSGTGRDTCESLVDALTEM